MGTPEFNKKAYDTKIIRFPKGFVHRFSKLFGDVSFNAWVVNVCTHEILKLEKRFPKK